VAAHWAGTGARISCGVWAKAVIFYFLYYYFLIFKNILQISNLAKLYYNRRTHGGWNKTPWATTFGTVAPATAVGHGVRVGLF
jgi:hypothetical protein